MAWNWALYMHAFTALIALALGVPQLAKKRGTPTHVALGRVYGVCIYLAAISSLILSAHTTIGAVGVAGFMTLAVLWIGTMTMDWITIRKTSDTSRIDKHRRWMLRNFSLTFGAITLRIYLPILQMALPF
jgi:uncharacterized membrane protein